MSTDTLPGLTCSTFDLEDQLTKFGKKLIVNLADGIVFAHFFEKVIYLNSFSNFIKACRFLDC